MGLSNLYRFCAAVFFISAVNSAHANYIYDPVNRVWLPTATTVLAPPNSGSVFVSASGIPPNPTVNNGGFTTTMGGSIRSSPVNGTTPRVPITINGTVTSTATKNAVTSRLLKGNLAGLALGYGIETLLSSIGALIEDGGVVKRVPKTGITPPEGATSTGAIAVRVTNPPPTCSDGCVQMQVDYLPSEVHPNLAYNVYCRSFPNNRPNEVFIGYNREPTRTCYYMAAANPDDGYTTSPYPSNDLQNDVDTHYVPHPSDYPTIVSEPSMQPTETTVLPIPTLNFPSVQTTYTDLDTGETTVTETNIWHDYAIHNNGSQQPKIEEKQTQQTDTFKDGVKTSTSTKTTSSGVATGGAPAPAPTLDLPPFCGWAGIVCDWIGWTQEPIEDDLDLSALITDEDYERNYSIIFGDNSCPAPISINVVFLNQTVELSYEPACQLAVYAKPFVLISAYIFAIFITLGVVRNG